MRSAGSGGVVDVLVLSTAHDVADARLHRLCEALVSAGLAVRLEAVGTRPDHAPPGVPVMLHPSRHQARRLARTLVRPLRARCRCLVIVDPDAVPAARLWRVLRPGRRLVVDVHEDYTALQRDRRWARGVARPVVAALVRLVVRLSGGADLVLVADEHLLPGRPRRLVVQNLPRLEGFAAAAWDAVPRAVYIGDVRVSRGLDDMTAAVLAAPPWLLDVVGPVRPEDRDRVLAAAVVAGRPDAVRFSGRLPSDRSWAVAAGAWAGLALLHDTPAFREAVPTKLYEYAAAGLATLATPLPRVRALLEESGGGEVVPDGAACAEVLRRWAADPAQARAAAERGRAWAEQRLAARPFDGAAEAIQALLSVVVGRRAR